MKYPEGCFAFGDLDLAGGLALLEDFDSLAGDGDGGFVVGLGADDGLGKRLRTGLGALIEAVQKKYRVPVRTQWYGHVGVATSTPVSDGELVYVTYCQGQVAAYDLDGHLVWAKRFAEWVGDKSGFFNTPLLCDQVLIINSQNCMTWRALEARTGKLLWESKEGSHWFPARVVRLRTAQGEPVNPNGIAFSNFRYKSQYFTCNLSPKGAMTPQPRAAPWESMSFEFKP